MRWFALLVGGLLLLAPDVDAGTRARDPWNIWGAEDTKTARVATPLFDAAMSPALDFSLSPVPTDPAQTAAPARAFEYSDGYRTRAKIHKIASFATLPLFAAEVYLGQSLYDGDQGKKSAHVAVGASIGVLFGINTVTGAWNLWEARKDPNGRTKRWVHGLLMMAADAGFLATAMLAPGDDDYENGGSLSGSRSTHRTVAFTSIGIGTVGYLVMLLGR
jgi:hypothetical protein